MLKDSSSPVLFDWGLCNWYYGHKSRCSQTVVPGPAASASPGNLLEMQTLGPYPRPPGLETQGLRPHDLLTRFLGELTCADLGKNPVPGIQHLPVEFIPWFFSMSLSLKWSHSVVSDPLRPRGLYSPPGSSVHGILQARILEWEEVIHAKHLACFRDADPLPVKPAFHDLLGSTWS